jgi:hypothetical protein
LSARITQPEVLNLVMADIFSLALGNPVEDERDSGLKPNTIPL